MRPTLALPLAALTSIALFGCGASGTVGLDGGAAEDAGLRADAAEAHDAAPVADGGARDAEAVDDAGVLTDAGATMDAGQAEEDAGAADAGEPPDAGWPADAGLPDLGVVDAGVPDLGVPWPDGGFLDDGGLPDLGIPWPDGGFLDDGGLPDLGIPWPDGGFLDDGGLPDLGIPWPDGGPPRDGALPDFGIVLPDGGLATAVQLVNANVYLNLGPPTAPDPVVASVDLSFDNPGNAVENVEVTQAALVGASGQSLFPMEAPGGGNVHPAPPGVSNETFTKPLGAGSPLTNPSAMCGQPGLLFVTVNGQPAPLVFRLSSLTCVY